MTFLTPLPGTTVTLDGTVLVLPQPSLASLPQLAGDLLIHTFKLKRVGWILEDYIPSVSGIDSASDDDVTDEGVCFGTEVYQDAASTVTLVLPRSPVIRARRAQHLAALREWVDKAAFKDVLVVGSVDAAFREDDGLREPSPLRHLAASTPSSSSALRSSLAQLPPYPAASASEGFLPESGLTKRTLAALPSASALLVYAAEGENVALSELLAEALVEVLGLPKDAVAKGWTQPKSWKTGLMGNELERDQASGMFG